jgi:KaiC/GvpD/RAD55 family RecA-like ATPase
MTHLLTTGIDLLDRVLEGGVPAGSIISLEASPASQSELVLYELSGRRPTLYLSAERSKQAVESALQYYDADIDNVDVLELDSTDPFGRLTTVMRSLPEGALVVVDPVDTLEAHDRSDHVAFLKLLKESLTEVGGFAVLHCLDDADTSRGRVTTLYHSDAVFSLATDVSEGEVSNWLAIPKFRGKRALNETLKLDLTECVNIDTSRNIF